MKRLLTLVAGVSVALAAFGQTPRQARGTLGISNGYTFTAVPSRVPSATDAQQKLVDALVAEVKDKADAVVAARHALAVAGYQVPVNEAELRAKVEALANAELSLALARANGFMKIQLSENRFAADQFRGVIQFVTFQPAPASPSWNTTAPVALVGRPSPAPAPSNRRIQAQPLMLGRRP